MGWEGAVGCLVAVGLGGTVRVAVIRREARGRPFRFMSVWVVWVCLALAPCVYFAPRCVENL